MTACSEWRELPFREIWCVDTEFYPGPGKANGGVDGDASMPLCLVAIEMRSGRTIRLWQDELGPFPPYRLDAEALFIGYMLSAEFGFHVARNWGQPACALDPYVEFRHYVNDGAVRAADREKGFHSLAGALRYFCEDELDTAHKEDMQARIVQGPPFTAEDRSKILDYCEDDVRALVQAVKHLVPTIRSLPHALFRGKFQWAIAQQERRGVPIDLALLNTIREHWDGMRADLVREMDQPFGIYEFDDAGQPHWRRERFKDYVRRTRMTWPTYPNGLLDETDQTFRDMAGKYPFIEPLRELRYSLSKLRLNDLQVGSDGRNRALLGAYGTKTARNAPSNSKFVFGPAKWIRFLIAPPPGLALVHRDYKQQEVRIAAIVSGDTALLQACEGDVYLGIATQLGFVRGGMSDAELKAVRTMFKTVVLGIQYGLGASSLAVRTGISVYEAAEILARLRARFRRFEEFARRTIDHAGLLLEVDTPLAWTMQCPPELNPRTIRNFPIQSTAAEILHIACVLAERRGIEVVAPIHDALLAQGPVDVIADVSAALDRVMRDASAIVLRGYELPTDEQLILPGQRYFDERGEAMWNTISKLVAKRQEQRA
jgi:hypothetical protein